MAYPILPASTLVDYRDAIGMKPGPFEQHKQSVLPQTFADQFGWQPMVVSIAEIWNNLPDDTQSNAVIVAKNYREAGAIDLYGSQFGLPQSYSGHNNYWLWGPPPANTQAILMIGGDETELRKYWGHIEKVGKTPDSLWNMPSGTCHTSESEQSFF